MLDKHFDSKKAEQKYCEEWEKTGCFKNGNTSEGEMFSLMMPPANVTGSLHMGHALTFSIQDFLVRYNRMRGCDTLWQPGTDHAGIAVQSIIERQLDSEGTNRQAIGRDAFLERAWAWKEESGGTITRQLRELGTSPNWERERFTLDEGLSDAVVKVFVQLYKEGLIYKDKRLVNWDPKLKTAISDLEVEPKEIQGNLWHFKYPLAEDPARFIVVATTRPETMLGDSGIAVHPEDERYKDLIGKFVKLPIVGRLIPIVADSYADPETGTGAVKITPAHDFNDFEVGRRHSLEMINILDEEARLNDLVPKDYQGLDRFVAREKIIKAFEELGLLERVEPHVHAVPHGDRSSAIIEPWLTDQWYVDAKTLAQPALEAVRTGKTQFVPQNWENTYYQWLENIQPWCISRQLWWGHRIPAWYDENGEIFVAETEEKARQASLDFYGTEVALFQDEDVLDTWFSSALWPFSTLGWPENTKELERYYPTSTLVTGFDIIFFWVARMMMMSLHFMKDVPFQTIYIHALVRDENGQKMSKSKGNVIDPLKITDKYGTDSLRFTLAALAVPGRDIKLSESRVEGYRNFGTKLWNATRYALMNDVALSADFSEQTVQVPVNRWIISELATLQENLDAAMQAYRFNDVASVLYHFVWSSFCSSYLEFTKPVLQEGSEQEKKETRETMAFVLKQIYHFLHPVMPFMTEELWEALPGKTPEEEKRLIISSWPDINKDLVALYQEDKQKIDLLILTIAEIRAARATVSVPAGAKLTAFVLNASDKNKDILLTQLELLKRQARLDEVLFVEDASTKAALQVVVAEMTFVLPMEGVIDTASEKDRLSKEESRIQVEISKIEKKLGNENFISRAPQDVVDEQNRRLEEEKQNLKGAQDALERLSVLSA